MSKSILIIDSIDEQTLHNIRQKWDVRELHNPPPLELRKELAIVNAIVLRSGIHLTAELMSYAPHLKVIVRGGVGLDNIDTDAANRMGISVYNTPDASFQSVAELGLALILASFRHLIDGHNSLVAGKWAKNRLWGEEVSGKVIGLIGFGRVGKHLAKLLGPFDVDLLGIRGSMNEKGKEEMEASGVTPCELPVILAQSDIIMLQIPLTTQTHHFLNYRSFAAAARCPLIVNLGRWDLIEMEALIDALRRKIIRGVAIDPVEPLSVPPELWKFNNVLLLPHLGAQTYEAQNRIGREVIRHLSAHL